MITFHFHDIAKLLDVLHELTDQGKNSHTGRYLREFLQRRPLAKDKQAAEQLCLASLKSRIARISAQETLFCQDGGQARRKIKPLPLLQHASLWLGAVKNQNYGTIRPSDLPKGRVRSGRCNMAGVLLGE